MRYRNSRLVAVTLAAMLLGLIVLGLFGVLWLRGAAENLTRASTVAGAYGVAAEAIAPAPGRADLERPTILVGDGSAHHHGHDEVTRALATIDAHASAEDAAIVARVRVIDDAYDDAHRRMVAAFADGDAALASAIADDEVAPLREQLTAELERAATIARWVEDRAIVEMRQTAMLIFVLTMVAIPVVVCLVTLLAIMISRYQHSLRQHTSESARQAMHDSLTGLPNRALFSDRVGQALAAGRRDGTPLAVMLLDLDRFKEVNDTLGHGHGDELLRQMALRLRATLREADTVARLSGDEFAVLLPGADATVATELADRVLGALHRSFVLYDVTVDMETSIGVALAPMHGETVETIMRSADVAMYAAKDTKTGIVVYEPSQIVHQPNRLLLLGDLRRAIDEPDQLLLYYQPKISLDVNQICGVEALLRWHHPTRGMVSPAEFIPVAETTGLINQLTDHVLRVAVNQARSWLDAGMVIPIAVNLSPRCLLDATLLERVRRLLEDNELPPGMLRLEVTETAVMANPALALSTLIGLHELGVKLSIDDYGTGYSSMAYLRRLPVDELKVDRSFVLNMTENDNDAILVRSAIDLGHNLGLSVVAEGVEGAEHVAVLSELSCDVAQGFHYARPMPAADLEDWMRAEGGLHPSTSVRAIG